MGCSYHVAVDCNGDLIEWEDTHYRVNSKVFETEAEAKSFSRDLMARGGLGGWMETTEPATHRYCGDGRTEPLFDYMEVM